MSTLFLASTPLIALLAAMLARAERQRAALVLIEDFPDATAWQRLLESWYHNPFQRIVCVPGRSSEAQALLALGRRGVRAVLGREALKRTLRQQALATIAQFDREFAPTQVAVGNDRRPETQYALHLASTRARAPVGTYLDDGLFTYVGDVHQRALTRVVDSWLKRRAYGRWWQNVPQAGTSRWIARSVLAYPRLARDQNPMRERLPLAHTFLRQRALAGLARRAWREFAPEVPPHQRFQALLLLPHTRLWRDRGAPGRALHEALDALVADGARVAVKYHPREMKPDPLGLAARGAVLLPQALPAEFVLPRLSRQARVLGEASTALLAARWWRPDLVVEDLGLARGAFARRARQFLLGLGVASAGASDA